MIRYKLTKRYIPVFGVIIGLMLISSCTMFNPRERTYDFLNLPEKFTMYNESLRGTDRWWESFKSRELDTFIKMALKNNLTIAETYARVQQAWATAVKRGAVKWPEFEVTVDSSISRSQGEGANGKKIQQSHSLGLMASYELDLWGRIESIHKSTRLDLSAIYEDLYTLAMTISSQVAIKWFDIIAMEKKLAILKKQVEINKTMLELTIFRYRKGQSTALDVFQQRQIVAKNMASFPPLEAMGIILRHEFAILLGKPPKYRVIIKTLDFPEMQKMPEAGIPADFLAKRPDIRKAGLNLQSADWIVSAAKADRLPALRLSASYSYGSDEVSTIFDNWMANLAGSIAGPIFDSGARKAEVRRTEAVVKERLATYKKRVLAALKEVEDSMINEKKQADYISALRDQYNATINTYKQALEYYRKGSTGYINVLESLNASQALELSLVEAENLYFQYRIGLYRSLGGNWMKKEMQVRIKE